MSKRNFTVAKKKNPKWLWNDRRERIWETDGMIFNCNRQRGALETL